MGNRRHVAGEPAWLDEVLAVLSFLLVFCPSNNSMEIYPPQTAVVLKKILEIVFMRGDFEKQFQLVALTDA